MYLSHNVCYLLCGTCILMLPITPPPVHHDESYNSSDTTRLVQVIGYMWNAYPKALSDVIQ